MQVDEPAVVGPGEGEAIGPRALILAGREEFVLTEFNYEPGQDGPQRHIHRHHADAFYVLDGQLGITLDEEQLTLEPGSFVLIPPEVIHTFGNPGTEPGRYLNFHAPGMGFEEYLRGNLPDFDQEYDVPPGSGRPTSEAVLRNAGEGEQLALGAMTTVIKAGGDDGIGSLAILEWTIPPDLPGPVVHLHDNMVDSFYVLDGTLALQLDGRAVEASAGTYAMVPPGNPHTYSNGGSGPLRLLSIMAPGGFEGYLREKAALGALPDPASKYDFRAV